MPHSIRHSSTSFPSPIPFLPFIRAFPRAASVLVGAALALPVWAGPSFEGEWAYRQSCGWQHSAELHLEQRGDQVQGRWSDGSARGRGSEGELRGALQAGKLHVNFCVQDPEEGMSTCPEFNEKVSDRFVLQKDTLVWYQQYGTRNKGDTVSYKKYLTLHRVRPGRQIPVDKHCPDDDRE